MFRLRFIHCTMVSPFILHCFPSLWLVNKKVRNHWKGVNELYGSYLLHHANGQIHVYLLYYPLIFFKKSNGFAVCQFKSAKMVSCWDLHACSWAVILVADTAAAKIVSSTYDDKLVDRLHHVLIHIMNYEICNILCLKK